MLELGAKIIDGGITGIMACLASFKCQGVDGKIYNERLIGCMQKVLRGAHSIIRSSFVSMEYIVILHSRVVKIYSIIRLQNTAVSALQSMEAIPWHTNWSVAFVRTAAAEHL